MRSRIGENAAADAATNGPDDRHSILARLQRLRKLVVKRGAADMARPAPPVAPQAHHADSAVAVTLPGEPIDTPFGPAWARTLRYPLSERPDLAALLSIEPEALAAAGRDSSLASLEPERVAFIDTETTGLSPDTGTYTFLIGIGKYEAPQGPDLQGVPDPKGSGEFIVHQLFMRNPAEERAQLHRVEEVLAGCTGIISFNGRGFDLPLMQNRFILARMPFRWMGVPHLDLLPASRRVWRGRLESCRLGSLEQHILGVQRTEEDVPGYLIPDIYTQYRRTGVVTEMLARVFYHNLVDITSMPLLACRLGQLYRAEGLAERLPSLHPAECISLARSYVDLGWIDAGEAAYRAALQGSLADADRVQVYCDLGYLLKRLERREEAVAIWEEWIGAVPGDEVTPYIELAKHHEWHSADMAAARGWTAWALRIAEGWASGPAREATVADLRHRLERLERKVTAGQTKA